MVARSTLHLLSSAVVVFAFPFMPPQSRPSTIQQDFSSVRDMYCTTNKKRMQTIHDPHPVVYAVLVDVTPPQSYRSLKLRQQHANLAYA